MTLDRRAFLNACTSAGIASPLLPGILFTLAAQAQEAAPATKPPRLPKITPEMLDQAAMLAGVGPVHRRAEEDDARRAQRPARRVREDSRAQAAELRAAGVCVSSAARSEGGCDAELPDSCLALPPTRRSASTSWISVPAAPANIEDLAFATVTELAPAAEAPQDHLPRAHPDVPRAPQALRPQAALRHHAHRRTRARAGQEGRRRDRRRQLSRPAARHSLGRKRSARRQRLSDHLGRGRLRAPVLR